jgi:4-nitrophenyl phosphatase
MKSYKGYLIDLDGTMYRGTEQIAEAAGFIKEKGYPLFIRHQ